MKILIQSLLIMHVVAGAISLVVAPIAMAVRKGGKQHRIWGKVFFWGMTVVAFTAIILSIYRFIPFLLMIAIFSYYAVFSGYRSLYHKQLHLGKGVKKLDWIALIIAFLFNVAFITWGAFQAFNGLYGFFAYLAIGFGIGGLLSVRGNYSAFTKPPEDKRRWLYEHIGGMLGGYIAATTAFSSQVMTFMPGVWAWIWPSLVGVPMLNLFIRYYRKRLEGGAKLSDVVIVSNLEK
ncbi:MAG: hypothetical protein AAFX87_13320 [Bacteroidota bacterium]